MELLGERDTGVLKSVVAQYIVTGEPVGSRTVAKTSGLNLSPATIRNLMLDLEEAGYLHQPHTSAGRIPTPKGFRYYVDHILPIQELGPFMQQQIQEAFSPPAQEPQELFRQASRVLSLATGHPALLLAPRPQGMRLKHMQFISLGEGGVLTILVSQDNQVQTRFVHAEHRFSQEVLDRFSRYLNELCQNLTLAESRQAILVRMEEEKSLFDKMISQALNLSRQALQSDEEEELYIEGTSHILDYPEITADVEKIRGIFKAFEEKHHLVLLLDQTMAAQGVQIIISPEEHFPEMQLSLVASSYGVPQTSLGSLGIIGPMRMDYARLVPIVRYTASMVTDLLTKRQS
ncbi:MAG: heat-inducible transcriptional repressor HrcA [Deltaproteobacteria bacterium]|jgi:heat-inducible transcriptional repressor